MKSILLLGVFCWLPFKSFAQPSSAFKKVMMPNITHTIKGEITGKTIVADSLFFVTGGINVKYYDTPIAPVKVTNNTFHVEAAINYPQMRRILLKSDRGVYIYRRGEYFIDASTNAITVDYAAQDCNQVTGAAMTEFHTKFIPFFYQADTDYDCHQRSFDKDIVWDKSTKHDSTLYRYVQANPASYVALWSLIERFSKFGHSQLRERTLLSFSRSVKASKLWRILDEDMRQAPIKQGAVFPSFSVKGIAQSEQSLRLPNAQYTLVDFWFSRCRPCIESFPALKQMYTTYRAKGFEIISISTDQTYEVPLWQKRIHEYALPWNQYLDENAVESKKLAIVSFPTTFLLDHNGKVLIRNMTLEDLEKFLATKLSK